MKPVMIGKGWANRVVHLALFALCYGFALSSVAVPSYSWDLKTNYSYVEDKLPEAAITFAKVAQLNQVDAAYDVAETYPNGNGLTAAQMQEIADIIEITYAIQRDPTTQELTGRAIASDREDSASVPDLALPSSFNGDWVPDVNKVINYYATASVVQQPVVEQAYIDLVELYLDIGLFPGGGEPIPGIGNGYEWRNTTWQTLRMCHVLPNVTRNLFGLSIFFYSQGGALLEEENPASSTDVYHNFYLTAFRALSRMDDNAFKWQLMNAVRLQLDKTIVGYPEHPQRGLITIDGGIIHHLGHHWAYASYSFKDMIGFSTRLTEAGFNSPLTASAIERFRQAAVAWAWNGTNGDFPVHYKLRPQHPSANISGGLSVGSSVNFLSWSATYNAAYYGTSFGDDLEMARPAIVKAGEGSTLLPVEWRALTLPQNPDEDERHQLLAGHQSFNVMGAGAQRRADWMASIRGAHDHRRGGEGYDTMGAPDHHHLNSMRASLLLITEGFDGRDPNSADSGYRYEGWDHNFYPNVTTRTRTPREFLYWRTPAYFAGGAKLTGGANLSGNGVWLYAPNDNTHRQSAFFFDNRITLVTSDITYASAASNVVTGLIQLGHRDFSNQPLVLNGTHHTGAGSWTLPSGGNHCIYDGNGNGYYIHSGAPAITAKRNQQAWTYALSENYIGEGSMPEYVYDTDFANDVEAGKFLPTTGDYSRVYFDHGTAPSAQHVEYTVLVQPSAGELEALAADMAAPGSEPFTLETGNDRHLLYDKVSGTYAAALFTDGHVLNLGSLVSLGRAGAYIWKETADRMELHCSSSYIEDLSPFVIQLAGQWFVYKETDARGASANYDGTNTTITLPFRQFAAQGVVLSTTLDATPPTPNPMAFSTAPHETGPTSISMTATTASDLSGVEYRFICTLGGGNDSRWQASPTYEDAGLEPGATYTYTVQARDMGVEHNETAPSAPASASTAALPPLNFDRVVHLTMDTADISGSTIDDVSGAPEHDATIIDSSGNPSGKIAEALRLDGIDDHATIPAMNLDANTITMSAWIKTDGVQPDWAGIVFSRTGSTVSGISIRNNRQLRYHWDGTEWEWTSGLVVADAQWAHVALVVEPDRATLYLNGVPSVHAGTHEAEPFEGLTQIGYDQESRFFKGDIDDVMIWKRALSFTEINAVYQQGFSNTAPVFFHDPIRAADATEDSAYTGQTLAGLATDADDDPLIYSKVGGPAWLLVAADGTLSGTPTRRDGYENAFTIQVDDGNGGIAIASLKIRVHGSGNCFSINFEENSNQTFSGGETIGPLFSDSTHWNATSGDYGSLANLPDNVGANTGVDIEWDSSNLWYNNDGTGDDEHRLSVGYLDDGDSGSGNGVTVTISNIPYTAYRVYGLYASGQSSSAMQGLDFNVDGTWVYGGSTPSTTTVYGNIGLNQANHGEYWTEIDPGTVIGNYWTMVTTGITCSITGRIRDGNARGSLAGMIIEKLQDTDGDGIPDDVDTDDDGDGIPDDWETTHGLDPLIDDASGHSDPDQYNNWFEYVSDTDPLDGNSWQTFSFEIDPGTGDPTARFSTSSNRRYTVWYRTNLVDGDYWYDLGSEVPGTGSGMSVSDPAADSQRFYRLRIQLP